MASSIRFALLTLLILLGFAPPLLAQEMALSPTSIQSLRLRNLGPALVSGRISDVAVDPRNRSVWYVGVSAGGRISLHLVSRDSLKNPLKLFVFFLLSFILY